jgi:hypothetical protein
LNILRQYSIVCQVPGAEPYTMCAYNGADLSQVLGITQANLPDGHYGWIQECGEAFVSVCGQAQAAYADFSPNRAKRELRVLLSKLSQGQAVELPPTALGEPPHGKLERLSQLPPLLIEEGAYCGLIREARDVFVDGHYYACVAMCGISFERFQRDKALPYGATREHKMWKVRIILEKNKVLSAGTFSLCKNMADLRDDYAHGYGLTPKEDALKSLGWMQSFIDNETNLMRDYKIVDGILHREHAAKGN